MVQFRGVETGVSDAGLSAGPRGPPDLGIGERRWSERGREMIPGLEGRGRGPRATERSLKELEKARKRICLEPPGGPADTPMRTQVGP